MNQKENEYFSKVEKKYDVAVKRVIKCPICGTAGTPTTKSQLVWGHRVPEKGVVFHRWSYATGRIVEISEDETNVL
mgnify:CR=1 FL=1